MKKDTNKRSLALHDKYGGKLEVKSKVSLADSDDLSLAYTPGVAEVCRAIAAEPARAKSLTIKKNTILVVSDGSAILGLGNLGALPAIPVMEGKAAIFKQFGGVDAFPICLDTQNTEEIIRTVKNIAPVFGGVNLEDFSAPRCFEIEERLRAELSIPVMHDDQWGTATVVLAALLNAAKVRESDIRQLKIVICGVGAAGVAVGRILHEYGIRRTVFVDSHGIICERRTDLSKEKRELLSGSVLRASGESLSCAFDLQPDVFIGLSKPGIVTKDMVRCMSHKPIIFALSNPISEISPEEAAAAGAFIIGTGRSDYPNQVNNALVFPGIFKAALQKNIPQFKTEMFIKAAEALASCVARPSPEKILPAIFEKKIVPAIFNAVS